MRSARKDSSANTLFHPCLHNLVCRNLLRSGKLQGQCFDKTRHRKKTVLTDEKLEDIRARLEISPWKSLRRLSQETGVPAGSASKATKLIKFPSYKV
jgi:hypothetical protein